MPSRSDGGFPIQEVGRIHTRRIDVGVKMLSTAMLAVAAAMLHSASALSAAGNSINAIQRDADWPWQTDSFLAGLLISHFADLVHLPFSLYPPVFVSER